MILANGSFPKHPVLLEWLIKCDYIVCCDSTPEAVACLLDKQVDGFGEYFRQISVADIGTSSMQSRALAGLANGTLVCCLPGSTNACRTAWDGILGEQLDNRHRPCNFVPHLKQAAPCGSRG